MNQLALDCITLYVKAPLALNKLGYSDDIPSTVDSRRFIIIKSIYTLVIMGSSRQSRKQ